MENNTEAANDKTKQIKYYYLFHKKIEKIFKTGFNPFFKKWIESGCKD